MGGDLRALVERQKGNVSAAKEDGARLCLSPRKMLQTKDVWAASIAQDKRYAGRWCVSDALPEVAPARDHGGAGGRDTAGAARTVARPAADT